MEYFDPYRLLIHDLPPETADAILNTNDLYDEMNRRRGNVADAIRLQELLLDTVQVPIYTHELLQEKAEYDYSTALEEAPDLNNTKGPDRTGADISNPDVFFADKSEADKDLAEFLIDKEVKTMYKKSERDALYEEVSPMVAYALRRGVTMAELALLPGVKQIFTDINRLERIVDRGEAFEAEFGADLISKIRSAVFNNENGLKSPHSVISRAAADRGRHEGRHKEAGAGYEDAWEIFCAKAKEYGESLFTQLELVQTYRDAQEHSYDDDWECYTLRPPEDVFSDSTLYAEAEAYARQPVGAEPTEAVKELMDSKVNMHAAAKRIAEAACAFVGFSTDKFREEYIPRQRELEPVLAHIINEVEATYDHHWLSIVCSTIFGLHERTQSMLRKSEGIFTLEPRQQYDLEMVFKPPFKFAKPEQKQLTA